METLKKKLILKLIAAHYNVIRINYVKVKIDKTQQNNK